MATQMTPSQISATLAANPDCRIAIYAADFGMFATAQSHDAVKNMLHRMAGDATMRVETHYIANVCDPTIYLGSV